MPSFDVVSKIDSHELTNAVDQANRELSQRFDFRDSGAVYELEELVVRLKAKNEPQLKQMADILRLKIAKRRIDVACMEFKDVEKNLAEARQQVLMRSGIDAACAREIVRVIKDSKIKVQAGIHGDKVRVTGKKRDDLQEAIALLRGSEMDRPLQFENFRD